MFQEFDFVRLKRNQRKALNCATRKLMPLKGAVATIVEVYQKAELSAYELEFVMPNGKTLGLLTVNEDDIELAEVGDANNISNFKEETFDMMNSTEVAIETASVEVIGDSKKSHAKKVRSSEVRPVKKAAASRKKSN